MTGSVRTVLRVGAGVVPVAQLARLGLPALASVAFLAAAVLAAACWVIGSRDRCERAARLLLAARGNASALAPPPSAPSPRLPLLRRWRRRPGQPPGAGISR
jgi:hypothetical protein